MHLFFWYFDFDIRERTVASLIHLGAAPGALTDPTPKYPAGRTPADLASANGHKGIAGYLAESDLCTYVSSLNLDTQDSDAAEISGEKAVQNISDSGATPIGDGDLTYGLSLKDSLAAVCNATQAAARIHQVFRVQSFHKRQLKEYGNDKFGMSEERALSLIAVKTNKPGQHDEPVHAAIRIQNKFRGWKGRKEFLIIRQQIVKIQVRCHYCFCSHDFSTPILSFRHLYILNFSCSCLSLFKAQCLILIFGFSVERLM